MYYQLQGHVYVQVTITLHYLPQDAILTVTLAPITSSLKHEAVGLTTRVLSISTELPQNANRFLRK